MSSIYLHSATTSHFLDPELDCLPWMLLACFLRGAGAGASSVGARVPAVVLLVVLALVVVVLVVEFPPCLGSWPSRYQWCHWLQLGAADQVEFPPCLGSQPSRSRW